MPDQVRITDVSPRDGLQNEPGVIPTEQKVELVRLLTGTGVDEIEVSSFVSPKWVPQLGDAVAVFRGVAAANSQRWKVAARQGDQPPQQPVYSALVPNERGLDALRELGDSGPTHISVFTAASETFARKNTNATVAQTLERFKPVVEHARVHGLHLRGYISCAFACPFEGPIAPQRVGDVAAKLMNLGIDHIALGDTIGAAGPSTLRGLLDSMTARFGPIASPFRGASWDLTMHLHDTFGRAAECVKVALDMGVRSFDGAVSGLGGCPYASTPGKRAPGNISTQTLVRTIHEAGYATGVDLDRLEEAGRFAAKIVNDSRLRAASTTAGGANA